jgi:hypothetical protein
MLLLGSREITSCICLCFGHSFLLLANSTQSAISRAYPSSHTPLKFLPTSLSHGPLLASSVEHLSAGYPSFSSVLEYAHPIGNDTWYSSYYRLPTVDVRATSRQNIPWGKREMRNLCWAQTCKWQLQVTSPCSGRMMCTCETLVHGSVGSQLHSHRDLDIESRSLVEF